MLDKAEYSAFESTLYSPIVSYRIGFSFVAFSFSTFDTVGWVFWPVKIVSHDLYCVGGRRGRKTLLTECRTRRVDWCPVTDCCYYSIADNIVRCSGGSGRSSPKLPMVRRAGRCIDYLTNGILPLMSRRTLGILGGIAAGRWQRRRRVNMRGCLMWSHSQNGAEIQSFYVSVLLHTPINSVIFQRLTADGYLVDGVCCRLQLQAISGVSHHAVMKWHIACRLLDFVIEELSNSSCTCANKPTQPIGLHVNADNAVERTRKKPIFQLSQVASRSRELSHAYNRFRLIARWQTASFVYGLHNEKLA